VKVHVKGGADLLGRIFDRILSGTAVLAGLILLFITFSISYGIFTRALGYQSPVWTVQFSEYSLLWMTFLGSAWVLSRRKHVAMDIVTGRFNPRNRRVAEMVHSFMGIGLCGVLCWFSSLITLSLFQRGVTDVQAVDLPKHLIVIIIPIGFLLLMVQFARNLIAALERTENDQGTGTKHASESESSTSDSSDSKGRKKRGRKNR
jgi:C4-dicarboxylate transporter, DctQ subunit